MSYFGYNLVLLMHLWSHRLTGRLRFDGIEDAAGEEVSLVDGGLDSQETWMKLGQYLDQYRFSFHQQSQGGMGNRALMAAFLQTVSRKRSVHLGSLARIVDAPRPFLQPAYLPVRAISDLEAPLDGASVQQEALLVVGRKLLAVGDFLGAGLVLARARDLRLDHAGVLCCLAQARFYDTSRPLEERVADALPLLTLATELGLEDPVMIAQASALQRDLDSARLSLSASGGASDLTMAANRVDR